LFSSINSPSNAQSDEVVVGPVKELYQLATFAQHLEPGRKTFAVKVPGAKANSQPKEQDRR
jgi:hypothetical protein